MEFEDPTAKLAAELARQARLYSDPLAGQSGALAQIARDTQAHARLMESIKGTAWMRETQRLAHAYDFKFTSFAQEAAEQLRAFQDSGAFRFMKEAQAAARQFEESGIMKILRDSETQRRLVEAASGFSHIAQSVHKMLAEPAVMKMVREAAETAAHYRRLGIDMAQMAGTMPHFALEGISTATAELEAIEASIAARPDQRDGKAVAESFERLIHALENLLDGVRSPVERKTILKFLEWAIPIVLMLWIAYAQHEDSVESQTASDRTAAVAHQDSKNIEKALEKLADRFGNEQAQDDPAQYYEVIRLVPVCEGKKLHGGNLFVLIPGSVVELTGRHGKWVEVCAISPSGKTTKGWVLKKYLKRQKR